MSVSKKSSAIGLGVHLSSGATIHRGYKENEALNGDKMFLAAGFTLDSTVAMNNLFNYRIHIDFTNAIGNVKYHHEAVNIQNSFGFGVVRRQNFRFWLGPHVHLFYDFNRGVDSNVGLVFGFNCNMSNKGTFAIDFGVRGLPLNNGARVEPFVNAAVLFRVKDEYSNETLIYTPVK